MFLGLKQHQQFFGTCFCIFLQESPPRLLCEASLCTQLQDQTNIHHYPSEQERSAALENCQGKEDKKQWSNQDMEEESAAQNQQKYQCRAAKHRLPSTNQNENCTVAAFKKWEPPPHVIHWHKSSPTYLSTLCNVPQIELIFREPAVILLYFCRLCD